MEIVNRAAASLREYAIRPNEQRADWPQRKKFKDKEDFEKAIEALQKTIPYYGHPYDDNLDWREMVLAIKAELSESRTYCWTAPSSFDGKICVVRPQVRYSDKTPDGRRYVYVTWELR